MSRFVLPFLCLIACLSFLGSACHNLPARGLGEGGQPKAQAPPNVIVFFADDLGWGDVGSYEGALLKTPNLDRMAMEGLRLTSFYVGSPACSPSRAALLTGCYPQRVSVPQVLNPGSPSGLHPDEETLAELLRDEGFRTAMVGKWHLGNRPEWMPEAQGFESWTGLPYSNDMWPYNHGNHDLGLIGNPNWPDLPLYDGGEVVVLNPRQESLTPLYTQRALDFVRDSKEQPFFLYYAFSHPHVPIAASAEFKGKSGQGLYADMVLEIDDAVGQVLAELAALGLDQNTICVFTSDNGPWTRFGDHAGTTGPWRGDKGTCFEGGMRMPCIVWGPGQVPGGRISDHLTTAMDLVPTVCALTGADLPVKAIDGHDMSALWTAQGQAPEYEAFFYYYPDQLHAVRKGKWKVHVAHPWRKVLSQGSQGRKGEQAFVPFGQALFDLDADPGESTDVSAQNPDVLADLLGEIERARATFGDSLTKSKGSAVREPGRVPRSK